MCKCTDEFHMDLITVNEKKKKPVIPTFDEPTPYEGVLTTVRVRSPTTDKTYERSEKGFRDLWNDVSDELLGQPLIYSRVFLMREIIFKRAVANGFEITPVEEWLPPRSSLDNTNLRPPMVLHDFWVSWVTGWFKHFSVVLRDGYVLELVDDL